MKSRFLYFPLLFFIYLQMCLFAQEQVTVARIKYAGGGDWYGNRTTFVNIFRYLREHTNVVTAERESSVEIMSKDFFRYPICYIAGHGNIRFSGEEISRFRKYLTNGGFLWADLP